jgi:hypothetical protein
VNPPPVRCRMTQRGELLRPENYLEVGLTADEREIVVNVPVSDGTHHLVFSADQARRLAKLLLRKADECRCSAKRVPVS